MSLLAFSMRPLKRGEEKIEKERILIHIDAFQIDVTKVVMFLEWLGVYQAKG